MGARLSISGSSTWVIHSFIVTMYLLSLHICGATVVNKSRTKGIVVQGSHRTTHSFQNPRSPISLGRPGVSLVLVGAWRMIDKPPAPTPKPTVRRLILHWLPLSSLGGCPEIIHRTLYDRADLQSPMLEAFEQLFVVVEGGGVKRIKGLIR